MKKEVKIGIFTILVIVGAWGGVRFLSGSDLFRGDNIYYAHYDTIEGLQNASPVYVKGVKVGSVADIELNTDHDAKVAIKLAILNKYRIPKDSKAKIFSDGLIGSKAIELSVGGSSEYLDSGDTIATEPSVDILDVAGEELKMLKSKIDTIANELSVTLQNLNTILSNNTQGLESLINNLDALSANLNGLIANNSENITEVVSGFATLSQTLGENSDNIEGIINNLNALTADLDNAEIDATLQQIKSILVKVNNNEGNIGKIVNDEELYANLASATANLDSLLYDFKQNPQRYVHLSLFGVNEQKQKAKAEKRAAKEAHRAE